VAAAPAAAETPQLTAFLKQGSAGPNVARVQRALHIGATRRFDRRTKGAVLKFQRKSHLLVDGIVGYQTWDALFHITPPPATATATTTSTSASSTGSASSSTGYSVPSSIVQCESGGSYSAVNPSSGAGGAYQIMPSTWAAYGGQGLPQNAPKAEQDRIAAQIYANQGSSAWSC
jgi:peptidoglycan hydrolase-like protein with peptidoglycan-binding domain